MTTCWATEKQRERSPTYDSSPIPTEDKEIHGYYSEAPNRARYLVAMRLKKIESNFSGDSTKCSDECTDE